MSKPNKLLSPHQPSAEYAPGQLSPWVLSLENQVFHARAVSGDGQGPSWSVAYLAAEGQTILEVGYRLVEVPPMMWQAGPQQTVIGSCLLNNEDSLLYGLRTGPPELREVSILARWAAGRRRVWDLKLVESPLVGR